MKILFVCSGNTCRSPLAEAIAKKMVADRGRTDIEVSSAGTNAWDGSPASDGALLVGMERGLDLSEHRSRLLTPEIIQDADLVLAMSPSHLSRIKDLAPAANAHLLGAFASGKEGYSVQDPFGGDLAAYRATIDELEQELDSLLERLPAP
jgi:protein-tyrosine-phosphatase